MDTSAYFSQSPCPHCAGSGHQIDHLAVSRACAAITARLRWPAYQLAQELGITPAMLSYCLSGRRSWSPSVLSKILILSNPQTDQS